MNFCQDHWDQLRTAVHEAGLGSLISDDGQEAAAKLVEQLEAGESTLSNYDPLLSAMFALSAFCLDGVGPNNAGTVILGGHCPMCAASEVHRISCPAHSSGGSCGWSIESYIGNAVADEVARAQRLLTGAEDVDPGGGGS